MRQLLAQESLGKSSPVARTGTSNTATTSPSDNSRFLRERKQPVAASDDYYEEKPISVTASLFGLKEPLDEKPIPPPTPLSRHPDKENRALVIFSCSLARASFLLKF